MKSLVRRFDEKTALAIGHIPTSFQALSLWLGRLTSPLMWMFYIVATYVLWLTPQRLPVVVIGVALFLPLATVMKFFFRRKRPPTIYAEAMRIKSYSFPSSHAYSGLLGGWLFAHQAVSTGIIPLGVLFAALPIAIGVSRVHLGAHYPSDVLAGWLLGFIVLSFLLNVL